MKTGILAIALSIVLAGSVNSQERYQLEKVQDGTLRLDRKTGEVSYCRKIGSSVVCTMAADERGVLLRAAEELEQRVEELEKRLAAVEADVASQKNQKDVMDEEIMADDQPAADLKGDENEMDKALRVTETVMRRFIGMIKELNTELGSN